jgi:hypothetical protein
MAEIRNPDLSIDVLRARYSYCPDDGAVTSTRTGGPIRTTNGKGYLRAALCGGRINMRVHRLGWALHYGHWPEGELDHVNGQRDDNRLSNLRILSRKDNARNRRPTCRAGFLGVRQLRGGRFYGVLTGDDGRRKHTPRRATAREAAVDVAELGLFFLNRSGFTFEPAVAREACSRNGFDLELLQLFDFTSVIWRWAK